MSGSQRVEQAPRFSVSCSGAPLTCDNLHPFAELQCCHSSGNLYKHLDSCGLSIVDQTLAQNASSQKQNNLNDIPKVDDPFL